MPAPTPVSTTGTTALQAPLLAGLPCHTDGALCGTDISNGFIECTPASCPIQLPDSRAPFGALPANPFIAKIKGGKCECLEPQVCSEAV